LINIDVEGAELEVIAGASKWLNPKNFFLIEVHYAEFLPQLQQQFSKNGIVLRQVNQQPLPFLGRETRSSLNWWLVSDLKSSNNQL
jgi:histidinol-phosphate/aromatic aminotransferase/cobyric acid decarboxylase-like protein